MKNLIKFIWKRLTCDHDYWWNYKATWGKEFGDHELIEISCRCEKCGKKCEGNYPHTIKVSETHSVACYLYEEGGVSDGE
jgi:hypothetical protein